MVQAIKVSRIIEVPDDVEVHLEGKKVTVKGAKGTLTRDFSKEPVSIELIEGGKKVHIWADWPRRRESAIVGTIAAHIKNMIIGVRKGFTYKLKIVFSHFPVSVKVQDKVVLIENFVGERAPRKARIVGDVKVKVSGDDVIVQGIDLEAVSQTAANIEQATKIRNKDPRVFLDGIYLYERSEGMD